MVHQVFSAFYNFHCNNFFFSVFWQNIASSIVTFNSALSPLKDFSIAILLDTLMSLVFTSLSKLSVGTQVLCKLQQKTNLNQGLQIYDIILAVMYLTIEPVRHHNKTDNIISRLNMHRHQECFFQAFVLKFSIPIPDF